MDNKDGLLYTIYDTDSFSFSFNLSNFMSTYHCIYCYDQKL